MRHTCISSWRKVTQVLCTSVSMSEPDTTHATKLGRTQPAASPRGSQGTSEPQIPQLQPADLPPASCGGHWGAPLSCQNSVPGLVMASVAPEHLPDFREDKNFSTSPPIRTQPRPGQRIEHTLQISLFKLDSLC